MRVTDLRPLPLFDGLTDAQLAELIDVGKEVRIEPGVEMFREGEHADFWFVLVDGVIDLVRHVGNEDTVVKSMDTPGLWAGGFRAWDEHAVYLATGRGREPGRVLRVPSDALRERATAWFPFGGHLIRGMYGTARNIESTVRQRESLVTLGQLAAGLAHEINNPAAAATRAVASLEGACDALLASVTTLARHGIDADQLALLDALRRDIPHGATHLDGLELADLEDSLSTWLAAHGVDRDWAVAPALAAAGLDRAWCERVAGVVDGSGLEPALEWVANTLSVESLLSEVKESTRRISDVVAAVKSYSQMDRASRQVVDVTEGLESTLVMLGHKLRPGVTVVRDYDRSVPPVEAYPGELNQVWTNLVDNAVDAMHGNGQLTVSTHNDGDQVLVAIGDTGPGMSRAVVARAFEAFYTTKEVGKGTGLGLDIARRIVVDRHGGTIDIDSGPAGTTMLVRIPRRPPP
ncbi:MAG TPA: ATP-binding protein [Intrasporangium sp.]|nr:ATP-binding protein [Intrasporangium sp.]